jgi:CRP-like cAMP-binding protein
MTFVHSGEANSVFSGQAALARMGQAPIDSLSQADLLRHVFQSDMLRSRSHQVQIRARRDLVHEGETPNTVSLLLDGWAARYRHLNDGRRQVLSLILPGELCDAYVSRTGELDHSISTLTSASVRYIGRAEFEDLLNDRPAVARAVWRGDLIREAIQSERLVSLGQRTARERVAHLLAETFLRLRALGLSQGQECEFPLTQIDMGDVLGLTSVHVNRTLQHLRREGLVELQQRRLSIMSLGDLMCLAHFDAKYLRLALAPDEEEEAVSAPFARLG